MDDEDMLDEMIQSFLFCKSNLLVEIYAKIINNSQLVVCSGQEGHSGVQITAKGLQKPLTSRISHAVLGCILYILPYDMPPAGGNR